MNENKKQKILDMCINGINCSNEAHRMIVDIKKEIESEEIHERVANPISPVPEYEKIAAIGKGAYIYYLNPLYKEEGGAQKAIDRFKNIGIDHLWIRIIGKAGWSQTQTKQQAKDFIKMCKDVGISVGGWGFIYDPDDKPDKYAKYVCEYVNDLDLGLFVHNAEFDHEDDPLHIEQKHAEIYWDTIFDNLSNIYHGLSSYWKPEYHPNFPWDTYMEACDFIAPQVYHVKKDPIKTINKAIASNSKWQKPMVITLQAFWGEMGITETRSTNDFKQICNNWQNVDMIRGKVIGVNAWHAGGHGASAMNEIMEETYSDFDPELYTMGE